MAEDASANPGGSDGGTSGPPDGASDRPDADLLRRLEERVDRAAETAERLLRAAAGGTPADAPDGPDPQRPPPSGWQRPGQDARAERWPAGGELDLFLQVLAELRERIPADLQRRLAEAVRELLVALRALIDWYLERFDRGTPGPADVQDIPIL